MYRRSAARTLVEQTFALVRHTTLVDIGLAASAALDLTVVFVLSHGHTFGRSQQACSSTDDGALRTIAAVCVDALAFCVYIVGGFEERNKNIWHMSEMMRLSATTYIYIRRGKR